MHVLAQVDAFGYIRSLPGVNVSNRLTVKQDDAVKEACMLSNHSLDKYRSNIHEVSKDKLTG